MADTRSRGKEHLAVGGIDEAGYILTIIEIFVDVGGHIYRTVLDDEVFLIRIVVNILQFRQQLPDVAQLTIFFSME